MSNSCMNESTTWSVETVIQRSPDHLSADVDGEVMLMSVARGRYLGLDDDASDVWKRLETSRTIGDLCRELSTEYDAARDVIERDVEKLITTLHGHGLVECR